MASFLFHAPLSEVVEMNACVSRNAKCGICLWYLMLLTFSVYSYMVGVLPLKVLLLIFFFLFNFFLLLAGNMLFIKGTPCV